MKAVEASQISELPKILVIDYDFKTDGKILSYHEMMNEADSFADPEKGTSYNPEEVGVLIWSSGTTSRSKGIKKTFRTLSNYLIPGYHQWKWYENLLKN